MASDCSRRTTVGVYLLDALQHSEREAFIRHLAGCEVCWAEAEALAPVVDLLSTERRDRP